MASDDDKFKKSFTKRQRRKKGYSAYYFDSGIRYEAGLIRKMRRKPNTPGKKRMTFKQIAERLNEMGLTTVDGKPFTAKNVSAIYHRKPVMHRDWYERGRRRIKRESNNPHREQDQSTPTNKDSEIKKETDEQSNTTEEQYHEFLDEMFRLNKMDSKFRKNKFGPKLKAGRICFNCKYRMARVGHFIICKHNNNGKQIWERAKCPKWKLTTNNRRLKQIERFIETKRLKENPAIMGIYYGKYNDVKVDEKVPIVIGRCCLFCLFRGAREKGKVECNIKKGLFVWDKGCCGAYRLNKDPYILARYKPMMTKSGVDVSNKSWLEYALVGRNVQRYISAGEMQRIFYGRQGYLNWLLG